MTRKNTVMETHGARGFGLALTPSVKVSSLPLRPGGFFF
jgi:hypothetical protein